MAGDASKDGLRKGTFNEGGEQEGEGELEMLARLVSSPLEDRPSEAINSTKEGSADMLLSTESWSTPKGRSVSGMQRVLPGFITSAR